MNQFKTICAAVAAVASVGVFSQTAAASEREVLEVAAPEYPRGAERRQLEGHVVVRYAVDEAGTVAEVEVVESTPQGVFDRAVLRALEDWRYAPAEAVTAEVERRFDFKLSN